VRTTRQFPCSAGRVWPLLCESEIVPSRHVPFLPGVPRPVACRLPGGEGGVGAERACISDGGVVHQRITEWTPEHRLAFRMERTDLPFRRLVEEVVDTIVLRSNPSGVEVTRTTSVKVNGPLRLLKGALVSLGVKQVHRYVFRSWVRSASVRTGGPTALAAPA